jgi:hypothetical protein
MQTSAQKFDGVNCALRRPELTGISAQIKVLNGRLLDVKQQQV